MLSTASAINATLFGTARLGMVMAQDEASPRAFSSREKTKDIPWVSLAAISGMTLIFVNIADLTVISSFASSTFLLIFTAINLSAIRLKDCIGIGWAAPLLGFLLGLGSWLMLIGYLWQHSRTTLIQIGVFYLVVIVAELLFSKRAMIQVRR